MTVRTAAAPRARWALGVLFAVLVAVLVALSVLAHHELMAPMADSAGSMSRVVSLAAATAGQPTVMQDSPAHRAHSGAAAVHTAHPCAPSAAATAATCGGGEGMCTAAGVAASPLPAALPSDTAAAPPSPVRGWVRPLPPGTGPPLPADTSSVLRI